jgi:hypothetical protein
MNGLTRLLIGALLVAVVMGTAACEPAADEAEAASLAGMVPAFEGDLSWPTLDSTWIIGPGVGVAVDSRDHIWVLHRPDPERIS